MGGHQPRLDEIILKGGRANVGDVVRIGDQVARPSYPQTSSVADFLGHLSSVGIEFVPTPLGFDDQGRHRLNFIEGVAPTPPYPPWAFSDTLLVDVAQHQHALHLAATSYVAPADANWAASAGDYFPAESAATGRLIVCHNDLGMTNTIVSPITHRLVGFIDFDYCRPVDPLFDIAVAARHWVPFGDLDLTDAPSLDRVQRFALFCSVHELDAAQRRCVIALAIAFLEKARHNIKALAAGGQVGFQTLLANGYEAINMATVRWLNLNREALASA